MGMGIVKAGCRRCGDCVFTYSFAFFAGEMSSFKQKIDDSDEDPVVLMLKKTGCIELHYKVQVDFILTSYYSFFHRFLSAERIEKLINFHLLK